MNARAIAMKATAIMTAEKMSAAAFIQTITLSAMSVKVAATTVGAVVAAGTYWKNDF